MIFDGNLKNCIMRISVNLQKLAAAEFETNTLLNVVTAAKVDIHTINLKYEVTKIWK